MFKQTAPDNWIQTSAIESIYQKEPKTVQIMMKSGRIHLSIYPMEYFLDALGPVGIKDWQENLGQAKEHLEKVKWFDAENRTYEWVDREEWDRRYFAARPEGGWIT